LNPKNLHILFVSKNAISAQDLNKADQEKWYGTKYMNVSLSSKQIDSWAAPSKENKYLHMPEPNDFIATDLSIRDVPDGTTKTSPPKLVKETDSYRVWYKKDPTFNTPKLNVLIRLTLPAVTEGAEALVHIELFSRLIQDYLNEYAYYAEIAGLA
jgi:insulysin